MKKRVLTALMILTILSVAAALAVFIYSKKASRWVAYHGEDISLAYPSSWEFRQCGNSGPLFLLPGTITGIYKTDSYKLAIAGSGLNCNGDKISVDKSLIDKRKSNSCSPPDPGVKLSNGLILNVHDFQEDHSEVWLVTIQAYACLESLFTFSFLDPHSDGIGADDILKYGGEPRVKRDKFLASEQYRQIKQFAESISINE